MEIDISNVVDEGSCFITPPLSDVSGGPSCINLDDDSNSKKMKSRNIENFTIRTTKEAKHRIDLKVATYIYATNTPFLRVEHKTFHDVCEELRPGYKPPDRNRIGNELLEEVYRYTQKKIEEELNGKPICCALDGWSNIHNEPIVAISAHDVHAKKSYLIDSIETHEEKHTGVNLNVLAREAIKKARDMGCRVRSFVTDNAANMERMRQELSHMNDDGDEISSLRFITYGCGAHMLNLLAQDLEDEELISEVKKIARYFTNRHYPAGKYKKAGGTGLVMPFEVRWNTISDCLDSYLKNWHILVKLCDEEKQAFDAKIINAVQDMELKNKVSRYAEKMRKIARTLDIMQRDDTTIADAVNLWKKLKMFFESTGVEKDIYAVEERLGKNLTAPHFLAYLLHPKYRGADLTAEEKKSALEYARCYYSDAMADIIQFRGQTYPFEEYLFDSKTLEKVSAYTWWRQLRNDISTEMYDLVEMLFTAAASSAGLERLFSTYGMVQSNLRNRLGMQKCAKLVTVFRYYNRK